MSIPEVKKDNLVGESLNTLIKEFEKLARSGSVESYNTMTQLLDQLEKIVSGQTLVVGQDGKKYMSINNVEIDLTDTLQSIVDKVNIMEENEANDDQAKARKKVRDKISIGDIDNPPSIIGILLKQPQIEEELVSRGLEDNVLEKYYQDLIKESDQKIKDFQTSRNSQEALLSKFGTTRILHDGTVIEKNALRELKDDKNSVELMNRIYEKLNTIKGLADAINNDNSLPEDKKNLIPKNVGNNTREIGVLLDEIKGLVVTLNKMGLRTLKDPNDPNSPKTEKINFSFLNSLGSITNTNYAGAMSDIEKIRNTMRDTIISRDYEAIKKIINQNKKDFGYSDSTKVNGLRFDEIDALIDLIEQKKKQYSEEIKYEQNLKKEFENSIKSFKELVARVKTNDERTKELSDNFKIEKRPVMEEVTEPDGSIKLKQKTNKTKDADGKIVEEPVFEDVLVPTEEGRKKYLKELGIDNENDYIEKEAEKKLEKDAKDKEAGLREIDKGNNIRDYFKNKSTILGRFWFLRHPIIWYNSYRNVNKVWNDDRYGLQSSYIKEYKEKPISSKEAKAYVNTQLNDKLQNLAKKDKEEIDDLKNDSPSKILEAVGDAYKENIRAAVSQETMINELLGGTDDESVKNGASRAAATGAFNTALKNKFLEIEDAFKNHPEDADKVIAEYSALKKKLGFSDTYSPMDLDQKEFVDRAFEKNPNNITGSSIGPKLKDRQKDNGREEDAVR